MLSAGALDSGPAEYELYGIIVHEGLRASTDCGHYVAYVRTADGAWWECNDQQARPKPYTINQPCMHRYLVPTVAATCGAGVWGSM